MNVYDLSRNFWNWAFENPDLIKPNHSAMYFFAIEHCNRLGWKEKFGFPTTMAMEAIGIKSYNTFINTLKDLEKFGFIIMVERSKNQYSANIIALSKFDKALDKALDEAMIKHGTKQSESTVQSISESIDSIDKQTYNTTNTQTNNNTILDNPETISSDDSVIPERQKEKSSAKKEKSNPPDLNTFELYAMEIYQNELKTDFSPFRFAVRSKYESWHNAGWKDGHGKEIKNWKSKLKNTIPHLKPIYQNGHKQAANFGKGYTGRGNPVSGKVTATSILANRIKSSGHSEGGNFTVDVEMVE